MRLGLGIGVGAVVVTIAALVSRQRCGESAEPSTTRGKTAATHSPESRGVDTRTAPRGSISGTVTNSSQEPIAGARVCADGSISSLPSSTLREPRCAFADERGRYRLADLLPVRYRLSAVAPTYRPSLRDEVVELIAGENEIGVDIVVWRGGVEVTGTISDLTGGPIAHAVVRGEHIEMWTPAVETDEAGRFALWAAPGAIAVWAEAHGYSSDRSFGKAPGTFEIVLTPESSIEGVVIDERTSQPIAGVDVDAMGSDMTHDLIKTRDAVSDERGRFRLDRLHAGRYRLVARGSRVLGSSVGSVGVGLGQHVEGAVVRVFAVPRLEGVVGVAGTPINPCARPTITLEAQGGETFVRGTGANGTIVIDGISPGTYAVRNVACDGFVALDEYPDIVVKNDDVTGLRWDVVPGATIRGRVVHRSGRPIEGAVVDIRGFRDISDREGRFEIGGLKAGSYSLAVETSRGVVTPTTITVDRGVVVAPDLIVDDGGRIEGTVVDVDGRPVEHVEILGGIGTTQTDAQGRFVFEPVPPGDYRLFVNRDDSYESTGVTVRGAATVEARLVVEAHSGVIKGTVRDGAGKPVSDAYVVAGNEKYGESVGEATRSLNRRPVVTDVDGMFTITKLASGSYSVRAFRPGGGEAIAEKVKVGGTVNLVIATPGTIEGLVRRGAQPAGDLRIQVVGVRTRLRRSEQFSRTGGRYEINDLPAGRYKITVRAEGRSAQVEVDLVEAGRARAPDIDLDAGVSVSGRIVDRQTKQPVPGIEIVLAIDDGAELYGKYQHRATTDSAGRFRIDPVPAATIEIDGRHDHCACMGIRRTIDGRNDVDLGDIGAVKWRLRQGEQPGRLGFDTAEIPAVRDLDPDGPAAKAGIRAGDVITSIDGIEIAEDYCTGRVLIHVPPSTPVRLGLARGIVVTVVAE